MRRILIALSLVLFLVPGISSAQGGTGVGIMVGDPTGLSLKTWTGGNTALDAGMAWSFVDGGAIHVHGDYLLHNFSAFNVDRGALPFYYGIGARALLKSEDARIGIRVPLGLEYLFSSSQAGLFFEVAPLLDLTPNTSFRVNGAAGLRYYFQ